MPQNQKNILWQQGFLNLQKSYAHLKLGVQKEGLSEIEQAGLIQFFEITFELAWKTLKDFLDFEGVVAASPREVLKQAYAFQYLEQGDVWLEALEKRNLMTHTYQEEVAAFAVSLIKSKFSHLFQSLIDFLSQKCEKSEFFGMDLSHYLSLLQFFVSHPSIQSVTVFGSRAMGNFKPQSDVDLCLSGSISTEELASYKYHLNEKLSMPYFFDVILDSDHVEMSLKNHIQTCGKKIYAS
jgi:nucleotidyltransferase substrate binding protein (TIGR01987 family)